MQKAFPEDLLSNEALQQLLQQDLVRITDEEELQHGQAFLRVCIEYLSFDSEKGVISDGSGDHGVDFIEVERAGASIIQSKSINFDQKLDFGKAFGPNYLKDLPRIRSLFENLDDLPTHGRNVRLSLPPTQISR